MYWVCRVCWVSSHVQEIINEHQPLTDCACTHARMCEKRNTPDTLIPKAFKDVVCSCVSLVVLTRHTVNTPHTQWAVMLHCPVVDRTSRAPNCPHSSRLPWLLRATSPPQHPARLLSGMGAGKVQRRYPTKERKTCRKSAANHPSRACPESCPLLWR